MRTTLIVATITSGLVLTACGGSTAGGGGNSGGPGTYSAQKDGVTTTVEIPTPTGDATMQAILDYATAVGASTTYSFLTQTLKNESGGEVVMCDPRVVTNEGTTVTFEQVDGAISDLRNGASGDTTLYNQGVELQNSISDSKTLPGATTTLIFIAEESVPSVKSVTSGYTSRELMGQGCDVQMEKMADAPEAAGSPAPSASAPATAAAASPTAVIDATDLVAGFPTDAELSEAQGSPFNRKENNPVFAQAVPLSAERTEGMRFGGIQATRPTECTTLTYFFRGGIEKSVADSGLITGIGFANIEAKIQSSGKKIYGWATTEYLMPNGVAEVWQRNASALANKCRVFTVIRTNGSVEEEGTADFIYRSSGSALIQTLKGNLNRARTQFWISEAIGDVLYASYIEADSSKLTGVNTLYNKSANALAEIQGVTRPDIDLSNLQPFKSDPSTFVEIPLP